MHKLKLTETECSKIQGAQTIIETLGYFPAMENTVLEDIDITFTHHPGIRYQVSFLFDLSCCGRKSIKGGKNKIRITFYGVRDVFLNTCSSFDCSSCGELKFTNRIGEDIRKVEQDDSPSTTPIISRPFTGFVIGSGRACFLEFFDEECTVDAYFEE